MKYLLDTNVVSETRRKSPNLNVMAWLDRADQSDLCLSVLTVGELIKGTALLRRTDPAGAASLEHWIRGLELFFADRILSIDTDIARMWGEISAPRPLPVIGALLAATAQVRGLTLVTRNIADVASTNVAWLNPWEPPG